MHRLLPNFDHRPAATDASIAESQRQLGQTLPGDYVGFLKLTNGGEGSIGKIEYVMLWSAEELGSMNELYEVQKYAPGFLVFGSNGGGEAYGFDTRTPEWPVVKLPFIEMDWNLLEPMAGSFSAFLERLCEAE
jgi:hypothetical protein